MTKRAEREQARAMRLAGRSYNEIAAALGVSKSSVSLWVRDLPTPLALIDRTEHITRVSREYWRAEQERLRVQRERTKSSASAWVGAISNRELILIGTALYWAEGSKDKPYARRERLVFINSDPDVIRVFARWLDLIGALPESRRYRLSIHESADLAAAHEHWAEVLGVAVDQFDRATLKRHNPRTIRRNTGAAYHGCLIVTVLQSRVFYQQMAGWFAAIAAGDPRRVEG
jgi:transcriptional regulator with XRE-family HTH domain